MTENALERRAGTDLEQVEAWASLDAGERRRRAAEAVRDDDREALAGLLAAWLRLYGRGGLNTSARTVDVYGRGMDRLLAWCARSARKAHRVDASDARRFVAWMQAGGLADKSVAIYLTAARAFVRALRWASLGAGDPFEGVGVRDRTPAVEKAHPYTDSDLRALLDAANARERAFVLLCADGGLRLAEAVSLRWGGVSPGERTARIVGKGGKVRTIAMTRRLTEALGAWRTHAPTVVVLGASRRRWQQILEALCVRAGVRARGPHALRHTCGTRLYRASRDLLVVARHLGHASVTTSAIYSHLGGVEYADAVDALDEAGNDDEGRVKHE